MVGSRNRVLIRCLRWLNRFEDWTLIGLLSTMVVLAFVQIVYRNLLGGGIAWIDPLLRMLVLWVALSGAIIATRSDRHIRIDVIVRRFPPKPYRAAQRVIYLISMTVCALIAWYSLDLLRMDYGDATVAFSGIPAWVTELILPFSFGMMALRFLMLSIYPPRRRR